MPIFWTTYLASADADKTAEAIKAAGGQVLMEPFDVMDVGRMFMAIDPGGAMFGVWQGKAHTGVQLANEPGSLTWSENMSRDYEANKAFYGAVFGYHFSDIGGGDVQYATLDIDGRPVGGIGTVGADQPADAPRALLGHLLRRGRHRRGRRQGGRTRRARSRAGLGLAVWPDGRGRGRPGRGLRAS